MDTAPADLPLRDGAGAAAPARDPHRFAPVFLLATARSCSSVVTAMIGQHPQLCGLPELKLFAAPTIGEMEASLPRFWIERGVTHRSPGLVRALAEYLFGRQDAAGLTAAREWLAARRDWPGEAVLDVLLAEVSPRLAIEKSPENAASDEALARFVDAYPAARYIHLTRDPAATQRSMHAHWARVMPEHPLEGQPMLGFAAWVDVNRRILGFTERLPPGQVLRLRAEDVLDGSPAGLRDVVSWLGLDGTPAAIEAMAHPEASPFARPGPKESGIIGGYDPGFLEAPVLRSLATPPPLRRPEDWAGHDALWEMVEDLAARLGYAD